MPAKHLFLISFLLVSASIFGAPVDLGDEQTDKRVLGSILNVSPGKEDFSWVTPANQQAVIAQLKAHLQSPDWREGALHALLRLDDDDTIRNLTERYRSGDHAAEDILQSWSHVGVIPYLAEDVLHGSTELRDQTAAIRLSIRDKAVLIALGSLAESAEIPPATRAWADKMRNMMYMLGSGVGGQVAAQFKLWWTHNQKEILNKDYSHATWVPNEQFNFDAFANDRPPSPPSPPAVQTSPPTTPVTGSPYVLAKQSRAWWPCVWVIVAFFAIGSFAFVWRIRSRKR